MRVGLIDVDSHNFPNLPLMKISAWHKQQEDHVEKYNPLNAWVWPYDRVYVSKVFSFTPDYEHPINAKEVIRGGTGYAIDIHEGQERYVAFLDEELPTEIEHTDPDYDLYGITDTAYGFLTRGCPRNCPFCHVAEKEGTKAYKVADLNEFWRGQKNITLLDPNLLASKDSMELLQQLADSRAWVNFSQGLDIRLITEDKARMLKQIKVEMVHFAWDAYKDKDIIVPKLQEFKKYTGWDIRKMSVYVLVGFNSTIEEDLERIYTLRDLGYWPYVMVYNKDNLPPRHILKQLARWVNMRAVFQTVPRFEDYLDK